MKQLRQKCVSTIWILKEYLQLYYGLHYPIEIIHLIILTLWNLFEIKFSCGCNQYLMLFDSNVYLIKNNVLEKIILDDDIIAIKCGYEYSIALTKHSGQVYTWGSNEYGQLGLGHISALDS